MSEHTELRRGRLSSLPKRALKRIARLPLGWMEYLWRAMHKNTPIRLECGVTIRGNLQNRYWHRLSRTRFHEKSTDRFLVEYLRPGDVVIDVGAHVGIVTAIAAAQASDEGRVYAFEIDQENFAELLQTISRNAFANVVPVRQAVGASSEMVEFVRPNNSWGAFVVPASRPVTSLARSQLQEQMDISQRTIRERHPMIRLDEFAFEPALDRLDLLKIDVDGSELDVLRGAEGLLRRYSPAIVYEDSQFSRDHGQQFDEVFQFLTALDYEMYGCYRRDAVVRRVRASDDAWAQRLIERGQDINLFCRKRGEVEQKWESVWFVAQERTA